MVRSTYEIDLVIGEVVHQKTQMLYVDAMTQDTAAAEMLEQLELGDLIRTRIICGRGPPCCSHFRRSLLPRLSDA